MDRPRRKVDMPKLSKYIDDSESESSDDDFQPVKKKEEAVPTISQPGKTSGQTLQNGGKNGLDVSKSLPVVSLKRIDVKTMLRDAGEPQPPKLTPEIDEELLKDPLADITDNGSQKSTGSSASHLMSIASAITGKAKLLSQIVAGPIRAQDRKKSVKRKVDEVQKEVDLIELDSDESSDEGLPAKKVDNSFDKPKSNNPTKQITPPKNKVKIVEDSKEVVSESSELEEDDEEVPKTRVVTTTKGAKGVENVQAKNGQDKPGSAAVLSRKITKSFKPPRWEPPRRSNEGGGNRESGLPLLGLRLGLSRKVSKPLHDLSQKKST